MNIPDGYMKNHRGALIPLENIEEIDFVRDNLVKECVARATSAREMLRQLKTALFADLSAFVDLSLEKYGVQRGGDKGNLTLYSYDGRYKVVMAVQERLTFDERLQAAKHLIDECLRAWTENAVPQIRAIIDDAFQVDKEGNINTGRVLGLRKHKIDDEKWQTAMKAIADAITVVGSKSYVRFYERVGNTQKYEAISLDIASV